MAGGWARTGAFVHTLYSYAARLPTQGDAAPEKGGPPAQTPETDGTAGAPAAHPDTAGHGADPVSERS